MEIVPLRRLTWSEQRGEYVELDSYGYQVRARDGQVVATTETREEALDRASEFLMLSATA